MSVERTLSIVKPDAVSANKIGEAIALLEAGGLRIVAQKMVRLTHAQAEEFYAVHRERPFYQALVRFMTEGPVVAQVLEGENAIARNREIMGATDSRNAASGTIRNRLGTDIERNAVHGSDGPDTAKREVAFFFSGAELVYR
ncbi:MAG: nucleoside-diphosphate kinase [Pseudomonadota bacterium]